MGCWASREKYEVTREWGGQVGTFIISKSSALRVGGRGQGKVPEFNSWLVTKWPKTTKPAIILSHPSKIFSTNVEPNSFSGSYCYVKQVSNQVIR